MLLKAAINGSRSRAEHPRVPVTPAEMLSDVLACVGAGVGAVHLHVRDEEGRESLDAADVAKWRTDNPVCPMGVSTGAWIVPDAGTRLQKIRAWTHVPDFASVNFSEEGAVDVARALLGKGVGVEAGLAYERDALVLLGSGLAPRCLRILLEPQEPAVEDALLTVAAIERHLRNANVPRLLHGTGPTAWPLFDEACRRGVDARVGLEDMLELPDGTPAADNAAIVRAAMNRRSGLL